MHIPHSSFPQLDLRHVRTFLALARRENFSRVGEQVGLSQSAVSRHIRALEDALGLRLFERLGRRAVLTSGGRVLQERLDALMREADTLPRLLRDLSEGVQGELRVGACITAANSLLPPVLGQYHQEYPNVKLSLQPSSTSRALERLRRGELDLAFVVSEGLPADLTIMAEIPDDLVLVGAPNQTLCRRQRVKPKDLAGCDFIQRESSSDTRALVTRWLEAEGIQVRTLMAEGWR